MQVIVETHSDHIINGVQLACKEYAKNPQKGLNKSCVCMYYLHGKDRHASNVEEIAINDEGLLDYQPKGFFDRLEEDLYKLNS